jgi:hypothetical protein
MKECLFAGLQDKTGFALSVLAVLLLSVPMVGSATGGLDSCHTCSVSAIAWAPYCLVTVLVFAGVVVIGVVMGGGIVISAAAPLSLADPARPAERILAVQWGN